MNVLQRDDHDEVWSKIRLWPPAMRISLASKILQSLEAEQNRPKKSLADLVGLWADMPPLTDDDVERILEEERLKKYG